MDKAQAGNFLSVLRTALFQESLPLSAPDWEMMAGWAREQSLMALFYTGASRYGSFAQWDSTGRQQLQMATIATVATQSRRTEMFLDLYQKLLASGLRPLVLKGIILRQLYGKLEDYRPSCDEDLFVLPEQGPACRRMLEQYGWKVTMPFPGIADQDLIHETGFDHRAVNFHLEMHTAFFGSDREDLRQFNDHLRGAVDRAVPVMVHGVQIWTLSETDHFLYLFFHLLKHFTSSGVGLRQMMDMMQFEKAYRSRIDWNRIRQAVQDLHGEFFYGDVEALGECLGFSPEELFPHRCPDALLADSLDGGVYGTNRKERSYSARVTDFALSSRSGKDSLLRMLFPPAAQISGGWPVLLDRPYLLPVVWLRRICRFLFVRREIGLTLAALHKGKERVGLLRLYGLLPEGGRGKEGD